MGCFGGEQDAEQQRKKAKCEERSWSFQDPQELEAKKELGQN